MRKIALFLLCFAALLASSGRIFAAGEGPGKWEESTPGRWESLPERHAGGTDNGLSVEVTMSPGTGVSYRRTGRWEPAPAALRFAVDNVNVRGNDYLPGEAIFPASVTFIFGDDSLKLGVKRRVGPWAPGSAALRFGVDNVNAGRNDYLPGEAIFPASVTFVFGNDSLTLGWRQRIALFFKEVWNGFTPSGIRLTYAWGNGLPVGSMYRLREEETVFVVAGPEEAGKTISSTRRLADDFKVAYGRSPRGPVTEVLVGARRPSGQKGPARASITVRFPAP